ncbi:lanthionine synthetase LanC family protein [Peribacillus frigoritolerans]|uniref:lanthionine synthetase LanC family protein n=1 Tax=Peribacillus frigoritolerans TaxID=450367 RepID=UPI003F7E9DDC
MNHRKLTNTMEINDLSYIPILKQYNFNPILRYPWAVIGNTSRLQGWKIHLSTIPSEAGHLLKLVCPFLSEKETSFKIAQDEFILGLLNEGTFGNTQIGKFMTIYPESDSDSKEIAKSLVELTNGFHGPIIISDFRLGDIVYTRYGGFNPVIKWNRLGHPSLLINSPNGELRLDSYNIPFVPPADIPNPFKDFIYTSSEKKEKNVENIHGSKKLVGPGYLLVKTIKEDPRGSVFLALDLRSREKASIKIIKQGRQYTVTDRYNRDMRSRLQHQEALHHNLQEDVSIPKVYSYFEEDGHGYLPLEYIEGNSIEKVALSHLKNQPWMNLNSTEQIKLLSYLEKAVAEVQKLHTFGYVHRDLSVSNIWITKNEQVYLLDLELTHSIDNSAPPFELGTVGFLSPNQQARQTPQFEDDIYSLGCIMIFVLTGLDPRRVLFIPENNLIDQLFGITRGAPKKLIELVVSCVKANPAERPNLDTIKRVLKRHIIAKNNLNQSAFLDFEISDSRMNLLIRGGQQGLLKDVVCEEPTGLWLSPRINQNAESSYEIYRDANTGVAGVIYMFGRLARFGYATNEVRERVQKVIPWLINKDQRDLPGLHFGEAGIAVALAEVISGGLVNQTTEINNFLQNALTGKLDWPDITHGAAGQGIAALYCADRLQNEKFLQHVHRCANYLIKTQKKDGSWVIPPGVEGMSGETLTGFAHGVSGIVYFLAEYERRFGNSEARMAWEAGANWVINQGVPTKDGALEWSYSDKSESRWKWWCHGSPGIALMFLRLYEYTQDEKFADIAKKALQIHPFEIVYPNLSQCHGISGLGEIYLEAGRVLRDKYWFDRAERITNTLINLRRETKTGSLTWLVEDPSLATADLMVGSSSVVHYLLRYSYQGNKMGFPLLLDPIK